MADDLIKIGVVGLANAGKTSLIRTLKRTYHIGESLAPTQKVERSMFNLFGKTAGIWDFGGQAQYRQNYLDMPERYFSEIRYLFFIIDMQDATHFPDALDYFKKVYTQAKAFSEELLIGIIFHKVDPSMNEKKIHEQIVGLEKEIRGIAQGDDFSFHKTTIYDPLTILTAFSQVILGDSPIYNTVSVLFANFALTQNIDYMTLLVDDILEVGSFRIKNAREDFVKASIDFYQQFSNLERDTMMRKYDFEGYEFSIIHNKVLDYDYTLNMAYSADSIETAPGEEDIADLLTQIEDAFRKYKPTFY